MVLGYHYDNRDDCFHLHHADHHDNDDQHDQQHNRCDTVSILLLEDHHDICFHHPDHQNHHPDHHHHEDQYDNTTDVTPSAYCYWGGITH